MESRTQGSRKRPKTQKNSEAKGSLSEDKTSRGQGQECSRPRPRTKDTSASALQKKIFTKIFQAIFMKKCFPKNFLALHKILTIQKIVLSSSRGQANFRGLEASRPRPSKCVLEAKDVLEDSTSAKNLTLIYNSSNHYVIFSKNFDNDVSNNDVIHSEVNNFEPNLESELLFKTWHFCIGCWTGEAH